MDQHVLNNFLDELKSEFGQEDELTEIRGLIYEYLGITIDYLTASKFVSTMFHCRVRWTSKNSLYYCPGNNQLFKVDKD